MKNITLKTIEILQSLETKCNMSQDDEPMAIHIVEEGLNNYHENKLKSDLLNRVSESDIITEAKKNYLSKLNDKQPKGGMSVGRKIMLSELEIVDVIVKTVTHFR